MEFLRAGMPGILEENCCLTYNLPNVIKICMVSFGISRFLLRKFEQNIFNTHESVLSDFVAVLCQNGSNMQAPAGRCRAHLIKSALHFNPFFLLHVTQLFGRFT